MNTSVEYLISLSDYCDKQGNSALSDKIDAMITDGSFVKVAQYVGVIGYALKQERSIANCLKKKRVSSTGSMQEVVMDCLKEYQDGQKYNDDEWIGKYADADLNCYVDNFIKTALRNRVDINTTHEKLAQEIASLNNISEDIAKVSSVWEEIEKTPLCKDAIFDDFNKIVQQAGIWQGVKDVAKGIGRGIGKVVNWGAYQKRYGDIIKAQTQTVQEILQAVNNFNQFINNALQMVPASGAKKMLDQALKTGNINSIKQAINTVIAAFQKPQKPTQPPVEQAPEESGYAGASSYLTRYKYVYSQQSPYQSIEDQRSVQPAAQAPVAQPPAAPAAAATPPAAPAASATPAFGQLNAQQIIQQLQKATGLLDQVQPLVSALFTNMKDLSGEPRVMQVAANEITAVNQGINTISQNPLNTQNVMGLSKSISALDQKLRNSIMQQKENTPGAAPAAVPPPAAGGVVPPPAAGEAPPAAPGTTPPAGGTPDFQSILRAIQTMTDEEKSLLRANLNGVPKPPTP